MIKSYSKKCVISGNIVEIYEYENEILEGYMDKKKTSRGRSVKATDEDKAKNREKTFSRARRDIRRIVNTNINGSSKFVTLTFKDNITDLKQANYEWKKFRQRLETKLKIKLKYLVVVEFQKRGAIHYHVLMFNLPYIKNSVLSDVWSNGFVKINKIDNIDNVGAYVCKYMSKDFSDSRLERQKMYFTSRGLKKPKEIKETSKIVTLASLLSTGVCVYENEFKNEYNSITYKQYNLNSILYQNQNQRKLFQNYIKNIMS